MRLGSSGAVRRRGLRGLVEAAWGQAGLGMLSLILAVAVWLAINVSRGGQPLERTMERRVEPAAVPGRFVVAQVQPERVSVRLSGPQRAVRSVRDDQVSVRAQIEAADANIGESTEGTLTVRARLSVSAPRNVKAEVMDGSREVTEVGIALERIERRELAVSAKGIGVPPAGFDVEAITAELENATIKGTRRNVEVVTSVIAEVKLDALTTTIRQNVRLSARDRDGRTVDVEVEPAAAEVSVVVKPLFFAKQVVVNAAPRGTPKPGFSVVGIRTDPAMVTVFAPLDLLNSGKLTGISTEPVDVDGAESDFNRSARLVLAPGVTTALENQSVRVFVEVRPVRAPAFVAGYPRAINLGEGLTATFEPATVAVAVSGPLSVTSRLASTDISVTLDLQGMKDGERRSVEPKVSVPATVTLESTSPARVEVTVSRSPR